VRTLFASRSALRAAAGFTIIGFVVFGPSLAGHAAVAPVAKVSTTCGSTPGNAVLAAAFVTSSTSITAAAAVTPSPSGSATPSPSDTASPSPTPDPSATTSAGPSPKPTHSTSPRKSPQLCVLVQSLSTSSQVTPGSLATFVIWLWTTKAASRNVSVTAQVAPGSSVGAPSFSICPHSRGTTCSVGALKVGQADALEAAVPVQAGALPGELVELTAQASAARALGYSSTATDVVALTPVAGSTSPASAQPATLPAALPPIPGISLSPPVDPSSLFPTVSPSPGTVSLPPAGASSVLPADTIASAVPVNGPLDAQLAGIAALGAVIIAVGTLLARTSRASSVPGAKRSQQDKSNQRPCNRGPSDSKRDGSVDEHR
jgi:hypothetical protein